MKKFPAKTEMGNLWIKVFDQPWTNTLQVVGVLTGKEGEELEYFGSNCQIDVPASKRSYQEVNGPVPRVDIFDENGLAQQTSGPPVQADSPELDALCADLERVKSEKGAEQDDKQDDQPRYPPRRRERVAPMCCRMLGVVNGRPHPPARALDAPLHSPAVRGAVGRTLPSKVAPRALSPGGEGGVWCTGRERGGEGVVPSGRHGPTLHQESPNTNMI